MIKETRLSKNWIGVCDQNQKMTKPTLIITGTEDQAVSNTNSLTLQIKSPELGLCRLEMLDTV